jgi:mRNA interferase MazF
MIQRGEVWWVDFNSSAGGEVQKTRPAIVVSNDASNKALNRVQIIPVTSNILKCYPCEAYIEINGKQNKAMADQIATVSKGRLRNKMGKISLEDMQRVEQAIKVQLDI